MSPRNRPSSEQEQAPFRSVAFMLSSLGFAVSRRFHEVLKPLGLEPGEFALLRAVAANDGESQNALAERLHISPSWMVAIVDELERRELLARKPHAHDRRIRNLHLTAAGNRLLKRAQRTAEKFDDEVAVTFDEAERRQLLELLDRVASGLGVEPGAHTAMRG